MDLAVQRTWVSVEGRRRREELASHFQPRAYGTVDGGDYFSGRTAVLAKLASGTGSVVVTGSAGVGKSAVLGRLAVTTDLVDVAIHARHKVLDDIVSGIAAEVGSDAVNPGDLLSELAYQPVSIAVDAVDEAGSPGDDEPVRIARFLRDLARLPRARVLVGARPHVVEALGDGFERVNLDDPEWVTHEDLLAYAQKLLAAPHGPGSTSSHAVGLAVAERIAAQAYPNYLKARIAARAFADRSDLPELPPGDSGEVFRWALSEQLGSSNARARALLTPLAFAEGVGLPWGTIWPAVASAIGGHAVTVEDIAWLLRSDAQGHVVEVVDENGRSVYRLYHEAFADQLREDAPPDTQSRMVDALRTDDWPNADPYVHAHLATHAAAAGRLAELVDDPGYLLAAERSSLLRALSDVRSASAKAYQHAAVLLHAGLAVGERASILEMSALLTGANVLSSRLGGWPDRPWHIAWMDVEPQVHRRIGPHDSEVTAVASGVVDGVTLLITGDATGYVRMWDFETGARVGPAKKLVRDPVRHMDALETASGPVVVCRSMRGRVSVWYVERDEVRDIEVAGERIVTTSGIVEGRALLAVGNASGRVELWDVESGTRVMSSQVWTSRPVRMLAFVTVEGQPALVVTAPADMENVWAATSVCVQSLSGRRIAAKVLHGTGVVAALDVDGEPVLVTGQGRDAGPAGVRPFPLRQVAIGTRAAVPVDFDLDGERVLATSLFDLVKLWDLRTGEQLRAIRVESREDLMVDIKPAVLPAGTARWLALPDGRSVTVANVSHALSTAENKRYAGVMGAVVADGVLHVPTVSSVRRLDADTGEQVGDLPVGVVSKIVSGTSVYAITRAAGAFHVLDVHRPKRRWTLDLELSQDSYVVTDEHAEVIVVGSDDRAAYVSPSDGDVRHVRLPRSVSRGGAALVDRRVVLMADVGPSSVGLIDLDSGVVVWERSHRYLLEEIHVGSVDGRQVAVCAASDHSPQILDLRSGDPVGPPMPGHAMRVTAIALAEIHGCSLLATGSEDHTVRVWDPRTFTQLALIDVGAPVTALTFAPDHAVIVGTFDSLMRIELDQIAAETNA
ncbi:hypothetical protein GCM10029964_047800 [Kibdelosporangium lantanae]